jgi:hypothetical protein
MAETSPIHYCHAAGCPVEVAPKMLMCAHHWRMVPKTMQWKVWSTYRKGQEVTKDPSVAYAEAAMTAVRHVATLEGKHLEDVEGTRG